MYRRLWKKTGVLLAFLFCVWSMLPLQADGAALEEAVPPAVSAAAAVLLNAATGEILFEKDAEEKMPMASTTKIMTAWLTLEEAAKQNKLVTVTDEMVRVEGSSMGLRAGYQLYLSDLAVGMLLASGNDAANAAALAIGGSIEGFVEQMNQRAAELQLENTNFVTPSGLDAETHYSTALDMARLGVAALGNEDFADIVSKRQLAVQFVYPEMTAYYSNHNKLLRLCEGCIGIKTGFTKKSGRCLVSAAERDGVTLVAVTLQASDDWNDHQQLYEYGFSLFKKRRLPSVSCEAAVVGGMEDSVSLHARPVVVALTESEFQKVEYTVSLPAFLYAPVKQGEEVGKVQYWVNGQLLTETPLLVQTAVAAQPPRKNWVEKLKDYIDELQGRKKTADG